MAEYTIILPKDAFAPPGSAFALPAVHSVSEKSNLYLDYHDHH